MEFKVPYIIIWWHFSLIILKSCILWNGRGSYINKVYWFIYYLTITSWVWILSSSMPTLLLLLLLHHFEHFALKLPIRTEKDGLLLLMFERKSKLISHDFDFGIYKSMWKNIFHYLISVTKHSCRMLRSEC